MGNDVREGEPFTSLENQAKEFRPNRIGSKRPTGDWLSWAGYLALERWRKMDCKEGQPEVGNKLKDNCR